MWIFKCSCVRGYVYAEERKATIRKVPEQAILGEVRRMVEEMQTLNKKLEETESAIEEYFKPIDKEAEALMKVQLEGEERTMKNMVKVMQQQALFENAEVLCDLVLCTPEYYTCSLPSIVYRQRECILVEGHIQEYVCELACGSICSGSV
ncbi:uncharacterized protein LOC111470545 isoform X2 [Cucurbita maxima]|uniref:Uncharacterized protein LOC111470545 isoform X2 n=1 Tax=Cucurbita maxima TaxID=3661 RepID=A0A6J1I335_CUCMA|nr:uncharacterized protein LOC111470545 isoform X2 [Cucurbita maxima]